MKLLLIWCSFCIFFLLLQKIYAMDSDFYTDEGTNFMYEDVAALARWVVPELIKEGLNENEIIEFYDPDTWKNEVIRYLRNK